MSESLQKTSQTLPKDRDTLGWILQQHAFREERSAAMRWMRWTMADAYARGFREFKLVDPNFAVVQSHVLTQDGKLPIEVTKMLDVVNKTIGLMGSQDFRPLALRNQTSRDSIRQRSFTQVVADSITPATQLEEAVARFLYLLCSLGCCGIAKHVTDNEVVGLTAEDEVIHPRELFPWPSLGWNYANQRGLVRQRLFPLSALRDHYRIKEETIKRMYVYDKIIGERTDMERYNSENFLAGPAQIGTFDSPGPGQKTVERFVKLREMWVDGPRGTCSRYIVSSGSHIIEDRDYTKFACYTPIGVARFMETGSFYGAGMYDLLFSMVREFEKMIQQLIHNVKNLDKFPLALIPHGTIHERIAFKDTGDGMRFVGYSPDPSMLGQSAIPRPLKLEPPNSGQMPGNVAKFLGDMLEQMSPVRDLLSQKGRVDSMSGLQYLDEQTQRTTVLASASTARAFGQAYKSATALAVQEMLTSQRALPVADLSTDIAGATIDFDSGNVTLTQNTTPDLSRIDFTIRGDMPQSTVARKAEAKEMAQRYPDGNIRLAVWAFKNNVNFDIDMSREQAAHDTVTMNILRLYGDGETPGQLVLTPFTEYPDIQIYELRAFMSSPKMRMGVASKDVIDAFADYHQQLLMYGPGVLPEQMPDPTLMPQGAQGPPQ